jgi:hypothetical protein
MKLRSWLYDIEPLILNMKDINNEMLDILSLFIFHQRLSIYQIHKIIEKYARKMAYMNTHKKVQKLIDLELIERETDTAKFSERELEKGAKFYRLSEGGIFVLFYNSEVLFKPSVYYVQRAFENGKTIEDMPDIFAEYKKEMFKNYQNCDFFELFLFPWVSIKTTEKADESLIDNLISCLNEFCTIFKEYILESHGIDILTDRQEIEYLNSDIMGEHRILGLDSVEVKDKNLLSYLQNNFNEIISIVRIKRGDNKNKILLSKPSLHYFSDLRKLLLVYKDKESIPNIISFYKNTEGSLFNYALKHQQIIHRPLFDIMKERINLKSLYLKAVSSIVMGLSKDDKDLKLLKEDANFMDTLSDLKERFNEGLELLAK